MIVFQNVYTCHIKKKTILHKFNTKITDIPTLPMLSIQQKLDKQIKITGIFCLLDFWKVTSGGSDNSCVANRTCLVIVSKFKALNAINDQNKYLPLL